MSDPTVEAKREFELLPGRFQDGAGKLYSRGDFLPLDDPRGRSEGDFIGRLRALFGPVPADQYVLRHRETGFVVTAYSAQSGPSYGGGPRYQGALPEEEITTSHAELYEASQSRAARVAADPVLAAGRPVDWSKHPLSTLRPDELTALREKERQYFRRFHDVAAPPGLAPVVARLDQLVSAASPADWETRRYESDPPSVYRIGVRGGVAMDQKLPPREALLFLLAQAEGGPGTAGGSWPEADKQAVDYWVYRAAKGKRLDALLGRVRAAWFRFVDQAQRLEPEELRALYLQAARDAFVPLEIEADKAEAALRPAR